MLDVTMSDALAARAVLPNRRLAHVITLLGDSRAAAAYSDSNNGSVRAAGSGINWANALLHQRFVIGRTFGVSGERTDQILARLDAAIATNAGIIYIMAGANDIGGDYPTQDTSGATAFANIRLMVLRAIAAGMTVIVELEIGFSQWPEVRVRQLRDLNYRLMEMAETTPGMFIHDARPVMWDGGVSDTEIRFRAGRTYDLGHPNGRGGYYWGKSLAQLLDRMTVPRPSGALLQRAERYDALTRRQLLDNPVLAAGSGGALANGATGTVPAAYTVRTQGGTTAASVVAAPDGVGNEVRLQCTFNALGDYGRIQQSLDSAADTLIGSGTKLNRWQAGDIVELLTRVRVPVAPVGLNSLHLQLQVATTPAASVVTRDSMDMYAPPLAGWLGPDEPFEATFKTRPFVIPAGTKNYISAMLWGVGTAASGSLDLYASQFSLRRRDVAF